MAEKKTLIAVGVAAGVVGLVGGYALGRRQPALPAGRRDYYPPESHDEVRRRQFSENGGVYWIVDSTVLEEDGAPVATVFIDFRAANVLTTNLRPLDLRNKGANQDTGRPYDDTVANFENHNTAFQIPNLGRLRIGHFDRQRKGDEELPFASGGITKIEMEPNTPKNRARLNDFLREMVRVGAINNGGVWTSWPTRRPDGTWPEPERWIW